MGRGGKNEITDISSRNRFPPQDVWALAQSQGGKLCLPADLGVFWDFPEELEEVPRGERPGASLLRLQKMNGWLDGWIDGWMDGCR